MPEPSRFPIAHFGSAALVLALVAGVWAPASYAEQRHRQDKVGDEWYKTDLLKVHVDSGERRIWARADVDRLPRRGYLRLTLYNHSEGAEVFIGQSERVSMLLLGSHRDRRSRCRHSGGQWNRAEDYVTVWLRRGCLKKKDRERFQFGFNLYDLMWDAGHWVPDTTDIRELKGVRRG